MRVHWPAVRLPQGAGQLLGPLPRPRAHVALLRHEKLPGSGDGDSHLLDEAPGDVHLRREHRARPAAPEAREPGPRARAGDDAGGLPGVHARLPLRLGPRPQLGGHLLPKLCHAHNHTAARKPVQPHGPGAAGDVRRRVVLLDLHAEHLHRRHWHHLRAGAGAGAIDLPPAPRLLLPELPPACPRDALQPVQQDLRQRRQHLGPGRDRRRTGPRSGPGEGRARDEDDVLPLRPRAPGGGLPDARADVARLGQGEALPVAGLSPRRRERAGQMQMRPGALGRGRVLLPLRRPTAERRRGLPGHGRSQQRQVRRTEGLHVCRRGRELHAQHLVGRCGDGLSLSLSLSPSLWTKGS
mmetsp:Transcript_5041/g.15898  ORF Transcript_5041/g.15898 Transcript_5041/m.15898 type:complete len:353 (+) Transcript_5041:1630-2688(+)